MRVAFIMMRPLTQESSITQELLRLLPDLGVRAVDLIYPEERLVHLDRLEPEYDLYVLKSRTEMALGLAGALHAAGAAILNPYPVSALLRDKITTTRILQAAGVPTPETFVTAYPDLLAPVLDKGPLAIKPYRGSGVRGLHVVWDTDELDDVPANQGPILAQRFMERGAYTRRIYCIGGQLFGVLRRWPAHSYREKCGESFTITPELRAIAMRCAAAFGVELFGMDVILSRGTPYVVDVQSFPGFKGVPDAALRLADYVYATAHRVLAGEAPAGLPRIPTGSRKAVTA
jgi:ribosomal protein S6--L-glutamate ligase